MPRNYLPGSDAGLLIWSANFAEQAGTLLGAVGITAAQAADYALTQQTYATAYRRAIEPTTRGSATVLAKNTCRKELVRASRVLARRVMGFPQTTDAQRALMGLNPRRPVRRRRVPPPATPPVVRVDPLRGGRLAIRLDNPAEPTRRGRPRDAKGAAVFYAVGPTPPPVGGATSGGVWGKASLPGAGWRFYGNRIKVRWVDDLPGELRPGEPLWLTACWTAPSGEPGPYAAPTRAGVGLGVVTRRRWGLTLRGTGEEEGGEASDAQRGAGRSETMEQAAEGAAKRAA